MVAKLDDMPGHLVRRFHQITVAIFHSEMAKLDSDITPVQHAVLATVLENEGIDQATLAGLIAYDRTTVGGVIDRLVQRNWLVREVNGNDRRAHSLRGTVEAKQIIDRIAPGVERAQQVMLQGLAHDEASELMRLLGRAVTAANDLSRAPLRSKPER